MGAFQPLHREGLIPHYPHFPPARESLSTPDKSLPPLQVTSQGELFSGRGSFWLNGKKEKERGIQRETE